MMSFSVETRESVLVACGRHCAICHRFCGLKLELHHIKLKSEKGKDAFENCIPLCFECHADMRSYDHKHPKGTKYTESELIAHRNHWYEKMRNPAIYHYGTEQRNVDVSIYNKIVITLPYDPVIKRIENVSFTAADDADGFRDLLGSFLNIAWDPRAEFIDPDLEMHRAELAKRANSLLWSTSIWKRRFNNGKNVDDVANRYIIDTREFASRYRNFIRSARSKLGVE